MRTDVYGLSDSGKGALGEALLFGERKEKNRGENNKSSTRPSFTLTSTSMERPRRTTVTVDDSSVYQKQGERHVSSSTGPFIISSNSTTITQQHDDHQQHQSIYGSKSEARPCRNRIFCRMITLREALLVCVALLSTCLWMMNFRLGQSCRSTFLSTATPPPFYYYQHTPVIYAHIHMAKTGGTSINGALAQNYERVCGARGYSYDSHQVSERFKNTPHQKLHEMDDSIHQLRPKTGANRGNVPLWFSDEIGYEDCDFVSLEAPWQKWPERFENWSIPLEMHLPCREPLDHLMSQCNMRKTTYDCSKTLESQVEKCKVTLNRFDMALTTDYDNFDLKCFDYEKTDDYIEYMESRLQRKRVQSQYLFRATNRKRAKDEECIWERPKLLKQLREYLMEEFDYYRFCDHCIGSKQDLFYEKRRQVW
jgi:hypothetical protein